MIYYRKTLFGCGPKLTAVQISTAGVEAANALNISVSAPVAEIRRVFCAPDGTVIYLGELTYRADFIRLDMDLLA